MEDIGTVHFRMSATTRNGTFFLVRAEIAIEEATIFIIISREVARWPFMIENRSDYQVTFTQTVRVPAI